MLNTTDTADAAIHLDSARRRRLEAARLLREARETGRYEPARQARGWITLARRAVKNAAYSSRTAAYRGAGVPS